MGKQRYKSSICNNFKEHKHKKTDKESASNYQFLVLGDYGQWFMEKETDDGLC